MKIAEAIISINPDAKFTFDNKLDFKKVDEFIRF